MKLYTGRVISGVKEVVGKVIAVFNNYVVKPFKSKDNFKQMLKDLKERIKSFALVFRVRESSETAKSEKKSTFLGRFGIDS